MLKNTILNSLILFVLLWGIIRTLSKYNYTVPNYILFLLNFLIVGFIIWIIIKNKDVKKHINSRNEIVKYNFYIILSTCYFVISYILNKLYLTFFKLDSLYTLLLIISLILLIKIKDEK